jgi:peptidoglycan/LPS O-acetylase OafA/YrhL
VETPAPNGSPPRAAVPDVVKPPPGNPRFPLFDGLRAIAALSVVVTHISGQVGANDSTWWGGWTARLNVGVTIFFLISGFLLYRPFVSARLHGTPRPGVAAYARRRFLRIVPAYWLALTVAVVLLHLGGTTLAPHWWINYGFAQVYNGQWVFHGIAPAWSLDIEVTFYALLPILAALMWRLRRDDERTWVRLELGILFGLALASIVFRTWARSVNDHGVWSFTLAGTFDWFALGMGLAVISVALERRTSMPRLVAAIVRRPSLCWLAAFALFTFTAYGASLPRNSAPVYTQTTWLAEHLLYGAVAFLILLPAVFGDRAGGAPRRFLAHPAVAWLGLVSYGIYLWHVPWAFQLDSWHARDWIPGLPMVSLTLAVALAATASAAASYYLVERPLLRFKDGRPRRRPPRPSAEPVRPASELAGRAG